MKNLQLATDSTGHVISIPKLDRDLTVDFVTAQIQQYFPTMTSDRSEFLIKNRKYVEQLSSKEIIDNELVRLMPKACPECQSDSLLDWPFKAKTGYFLSMGQLKEIVIPVKTCRVCRRAFYPQSMTKASSTSTTRQSSVLIFSLILTICWI